MKQELQAYKTPLAGSEGFTFNLAEKSKRIEELEREDGGSGFWDNPEYSNKKMKELKNLKDTVEQIENLFTQYDDIETLIEMGNEENDESMAEEIRSELDSFTEELETLRISTLLTGEYDKNGAILKLNAGVGGTESCDWCSMLYRMYTRWAERKRLLLWKSWISWTATKLALNPLPSR